jgi:FtsZ-interacting cell division protein ZipA
LAEFRWILLGLGLLLIAGIWWWGARHSRQAPGNAELREPTVGAAQPHGPPGADESLFAEMPREATSSRDWGVPPFEPLSIRTADFERLPAVDPPMMADADPLDVTIDVQHLARAPARSVQAPLAATHAAPLPASPVVVTHAAPLPASPVAVTHAAPLRSVNENSDRFTVSPQVPNVSEMQRIVTIRVCAPGELRWPGIDLMAALQEHGLAHGRYHVFHRKHSDGRTLFCAASLVEPGTFDIARMAEEEFRGLTLFAVLPGPAEPLQTLDSLVATAHELAQALQGEVQDAKGMPLSAERAAALREDVARFQSLRT